MCLDHNTFWESSEALDYFLEKYHKHIYTKKLHMNLENTLYFSPLETFHNEELEKEGKIMVLDIKEF